MRILVAISIVLVVTGCVGRTILRPVADVRERAEDSLGCGDVVIHRISSELERAHRVDAYEARGCGGVRWYACDAAGTRSGTCVALGEPPLQTPSGDAPAATVKVRGRFGNIEEVVERVSFSAGYATRTVVGGASAPEALRVSPGFQRIRVAATRAVSSLRSREVATSVPQVTSCYRNGHYETCTEWRTRWETQTYVDTRQERACAGELDVVLEAGGVYRVAFNVADGCAVRCARELTHPDGTVRLVACDAPATARQAAR
jgi:hypothetical protein